MNLILNKIRQFLINHTVWMHFTIILILSYLMIQLSHLILPKIYYFWVLGMTVFSLPALAFVVYRDRKPTDKGNKYWILWCTVFLVFPMTMFLMKVDIISLPFAYQLTNIDINGAYTFSSLSILYLILELSLLWVNRKIEKSNPLMRLQEISVFKIALLTVAIFCIFAMLSNNYFYIVTQDDSGLVKMAKFIYYLIQLFYHLLFILYLLLHSS